MLNVMNLWAIVTAYGNRTINSISTNLFPAKAWNRVAWLEWLWGIETTFKRVYIFLRESLLETIIAKEH